MDKLTISIFENQILYSIINELKLFSKFNVKFYDNFDLCQKEALDFEQLVIFFVTESNKNDLKKIKKNSYPIVAINKYFKSSNILSEDFIEKLNIPFKVIELEKKVVSLFAKYEFKKSSLISLKNYIIDKNQRKIKKNNLELQLTEKEVKFLILFSNNSRPLNRDFILKNVWNYSSESDTHTIETHIHRLRKKILQKFNDKNFIKNNDKGYYI